MLLPSTLGVSGNSAAPIEGTVSVEGYVRNIDTTPAPAISVWFQLINPPTAILSLKPFQVTSDQNGYFSVTLPQNQNFVFFVGSATSPKSSTLNTGSSPSMQLTPLLGSY